MTEYAWQVFLSGLEKNDNHTMEFGMRLLARVTRLQEAAK